MIHPPEYMERTGRRMFLLSFIALCLGVLIHEAYYHHLGTVAIVFLLWVVATSALIFREIADERTH